MPAFQFQFGIISYTVGSNGASGNSGKGTGERQLRTASPRFGGRG